MYRVAACGFAEFELVCLPSEFVLAAVNPVRPRREQLPSAVGWELVGFEASDQRPAFMAERAQSGTKLGHRGAIVSSLNLVLRSGERDRARLVHDSNHGVRTASAACRPG